MITEAEIGFISNNCGTDTRGTSNIVQLLEEGLSVPFISRYRKEQTGNIDEELVNSISDHYDLIKEINLRKATILKTIEQQGKLSDKLENKIRSCYSPSELEDLYLPYKPKKRTKAVIAKEKGAQPLADDIINPQVKGSPRILAQKLITSENEIGSIDEALELAGFIIAENFSENIKLRSGLRDHLKRTGLLVSQVKKEFKDKRSKFEQYYKFSEPVRTIPSHRILAIFRGENEGVLKKNIESDLERLSRSLRRILYSENHERALFLDSVYSDSIKRLVFPSIENEIMSELKKDADEKAVAVFATNLEKILLSAPAGNINVIALDPGFRTGCKLAVLDRTGKYVYHTTIFPVKPKEDVENSKSVLDNLIKKYSINAIVIGNGTASRETFAFVKKVVEKKIIVSVISESGASIYSASKAGREEFPELDVTVRGAISIGRRFQDPLSELVKLDPGSIGVGQYQHDVDQKLLGRRLETTVSSVVNRVGVDLNNSSAHILRYVSGIGNTLSKRIFEYRNKSGVFRNREEVKKVEKFGEKSFLQSAGFLRINDGDHILDSTGIHPESYSVVRAICKDMGIEVSELIKNKKIIDQIDKKKYITENTGEFTIDDIISELLKPGRDPRSSFDPVEFDDSVNSIEDLEQGMILNGIVTNITNFGAFIDIGVHQDGLAHISELSDKFVKDPHSVVSVGDRVKTRVLKVDKELSRISLSLKLS
ncbi:MAG: Tex family protein [Acidobacteriota bacterium]